MSITLLAYSLLRPHSNGVAVEARCAAYLSISGLINEVRTSFALPKMRGSRHLQFAPSKPASGTLSDESKVAYGTFLEASLESGGISDCGDDKHDMDDSNYEYDDHSHVAASGRGPTLLTTDDQPILTSSPRF